ncbi:MAG: kynureninase [Flavobacteriales bacterium]|nr:kynureninase [Flavobacteriales bacterium]
MDYQFSLDFARTQDSADPLRGFRDEFYFPQHNGQDVVYLTGNSLGLQPKPVREYIEQELEDWSKHGVEGHFNARRPWMPYHEFFQKSLARLMGAKETEVVPMNGLTTNLHLLMVSFFRPQGARTKMLTEAKAFPSDRYAVESQLKFHGLDPAEHLIEVGPREGEHTIREEDVLKAIEGNADELALVFIGGVNYYSGQLFDMEKITEAARAVGARIGWDLAHAAGNVDLKLHEWGPDFAAWCSYKYLNSGPGSVSGVFVHERHHRDKELHRFAGWWGHNKERRFLMEPGFDPIESAEAWQLSNTPVFAMAPHLASLHQFDRMNLDDRAAKRRDLTGYLEFVINDVAKRHNATFEIITPKDSAQRGSQLSVLMHGQGKALFDRLSEKGVIADWREPNVIRMAPVPMYNSYEDIFRFGTYLNEALTELNH